MICIKVKVDLRSQAFTIRRAGGHGPRRKGCKMPSSKQMEKHGRLVARMADRLGTDLDEAELRGDLRPGERNAMVLSCTNCTSPEACEAWLEAHDSAGDTPTYCRNGEKLKSLKP